MPILQNRRHEAFAQARAKGALLKAAFEDAGFAPDASHASRLGREPGVADVSPGSLRELRLTMLEVDRLRQNLADRRDNERRGEEFRQSMGI